MRLKKDERDLILQHRVLKEQCEKTGTPMPDVSHYWLKTDSMSMFVKMPKVDPQKFFEDIAEDLKQYSPKFDKIYRKEYTDPHCLVVDPADVHIGKLATSFESGEDYDSQIAVQRVKKGIDGLIQKSSGYNVDKIIFVGGNDILHIDTPKRTTTSGTPQDTDGMWYQNFIIAKDLYVKIIEDLLTIADVHFVFNPSNHDYITGFFLANVIETYFRNHPNVTFDCSISHRKYFEYGENLIGTTHGDGAKMNDLPLLMAQEAKESWGNTKHRYIYIHHLHHKIAKDFAGVTVEALRSPSGTDSWHHRNGYQHSPKAIEGFLHHPEFGQVARFTHLF
jgi:hypothetical protein